MPKQKTHFEQVSVRVAKEVAKRAAELELRKQKSIKTSPAPKSRGVRSVNAAYGD
jgi:aconitase A